MKLGDQLTQKNYVQGAIFCNKNGYVINPDTKKIEEKTTEIQTYRQKRQKEYPLLSEQLDMIYWDKINNTNIWTDMISGIKAKYPKE